MIERQTAARMRIAEHIQAAPPAEELPARDTDSVVNWEVLKFQTTAELEPVQEIIGQNRAIAALDVGLGVPERGYNIYAAGLTGTSKIETIKDMLQKRLEGSPPPDDWVYVHSLRISVPWVISLRPSVATIRSMLAFSSTIACVSI